ncbi:cold shock domain-containing protein [Rhodococcus sp. 06-235-1A]|uniref:cold shock domain-containing protein n=1 Tax=Rhodococcus sp. 06-235-1A TaxID=2022508 RepID=UPI00211AB441|nr:cold shock domain-containing protein [Rhodococcus sp. 06-235-1A]
MSTKKHPGIELRMFHTDDDGARHEVPLEPLPPASRAPSAARVVESVRGTVEVWHDEEGWGVIASDRTPGGCWLHYSDIEGQGFKTLTVGQSVALEYEDLGAKYRGGNQDGYRYRATSATR